MEIQKEVIQAVKTEIENMPTKYKFIALLWYFEEFTVMDISTILDIPEEIVEIRLDKVENMIRPALFKMDESETKKKQSHVFTIVVSKAFDLIIQNCQMTTDAEQRIYGNIVGSYLS